jgi:hypothetical protein
MKRTELGHHGPMGKSLSSCQADCSNAILNKVKCSKVQRISRYLVSVGIHIYRKTVYYNVCSKHLVNVHVCTH